MSIQLPRTSEGQGNYPVPFYAPGGNRMVYDSSPQLVVQCSLKTPAQETDPRCQNILAEGTLSLPDQKGQIAGSQPVWASNNTIIYRGCDSSADTNSCGIYAIDSRATQAFSNGAMPTRLTYHSTDTPGDTKGNYLLFTSQREGNWEIYITGLDGKEIRNLSNNPQANDGLPTISPDGNWVAFVSDRNFGGAVWAVPLAGGRVQKLFDLPASNPLGSDDLIWTNQRISWGP